MAPSSGRLRVGRPFRIQGQGYKPEVGADGSAASGQIMAAHALPAEHDEYNDSEDDSSNPLIVDELVGINKTLEKQIETLRLRLDFDSIHHQSEKQAILSESESKIRHKNDEISKLKDQLDAKDMTIQALDKANKDRDSEINELRRQIESLNNDVNSSKAYADQLASELASLTHEREMFSGNRRGGDDEQEITGLRKEVIELKTNLTTLELELARAREVIGTQAGRLTFLDSDKKTMQLKFKEELAKVSHSMRLEVEKMRDVMVKQWEEMRFLREQNTSMSKDIKDIRSLLLTGGMDDDSKIEQVDVPGHTTSSGMSQSQSAMALPQTARGGKTVYNGYNMGAMKPSLPVLHKDKKGQGRRK